MVDIMSCLFFGFFLDIGGPSNSSFLEAAGFFSQGIVKILGCPAEGRRCSQYPRAWQWCRPQYTSSSFDQMIMMNHHLPSTKLTVVDKKNVYQNPEIHESSILGLFSCDVLFP